MRSILAMCCLQVLSVVGCDADPGVAAAIDDAPELAPAGPPAIVPDLAPDLAVTRARGCIVSAPDGVVSLIASASGVAFAVATGDADGPPLLVHRAFGQGCDLAADDRTPVAATELLDADDLGNLYVFPAGAGATGALSTMLPEESPTSMVARVDPDDRVTKLLPAGRGIWSFGVAPAGDALWVTACGPTGIFAMTAMTPAMPSPETLWEQLPSVLTDDQTFWSVGVGTCDYPEPVHPDCGHALVRTTPAGSEEVAATIVDLGAGFEQAELTRCGPHVCGMVSRGVIVWNHDGAVLRTISRADALARQDEQIVQVSGNRSGVYVLLQSEGDARVVFVPLA